MDIEKNTTYACRVVSINGQEVDYLSELVIDEECITRITIKEVERKIYDKVRSETFINVVVKYEATYITVVECQLVNRSYRMGSDCNESKINLKYMSSLLLLDYLWNPPQELHFSGINCEITETTELLGVYPYQINYGESTFPKVECDIKGEVVSKMVGHGVSYFVTPEIMQEDGELHISMYGRIQYSGGKDRNLSEIYELLDSICLFFEIISGEIITIEDVYLTHGEHSIKTVGLCNFPKLPCPHTWHHHK